VVILDLRPLRLLVLRYLLDGPEAAVRVADAFCNAVLSAGNQFGAPSLVHIYCFGMLVETALGPSERTVGGGFTDPLDQDLAVGDPVGIAAGTDVVGFGLEHGERGAGTHVRPPEDPGKAVVQPGAQPALGPGFDRGCGQVRIAPGRAVIRGAGGRRNMAGRC
jgi:hypothetical protein